MDIRGRLKAFLPRWAKPAVTERSMAGATGPRPSPVPEPDAKPGRHVLPKPKAAQIMGFSAFLTSIGRNLIGAAGFILIKRGGSLGLGLALPKVNAYQ